MSGSVPLVAVLTARSPTRLLQLTVNVVESTPPSGIVTVVGFEPETLQLLAMLFNCTVWLPAARFGIVIEALMPMAVPAAPSTATE